MALPSLFIAHGAPDLPLSGTPARGFTETLRKRFPDLRAILVISAHWEARVPTIGTAAMPETVYDFGGFDERLYDLRYPARTSPEVISEVASALKEAGIAHSEDSRRGYDHGVWIPLMLAFPKAEVPVIQLSLRYGASAAENLALGRALAPLREKGVLIVGSGAIVHNLRALAPEGSPAPDWARAVDEAVVAAIENGDIASLIKFPETRLGRIAHLTPERLMPVFIAWGAAGGKGRAMHRSFSWGSISMTSFAFGEEQPFPA